MLSGLQIRVHCWGRGGEGGGVGGVVRDPTRFRVRPETSVATETGTQVVFPYSLGL